MHSADIKNTSMVTLFSSVSTNSSSQIARSLLKLYSFSSVCSDSDSKSIALIIFEPLSVVMVYIISCFESNSFKNDKIISKFSPVCLTRIFFVARLKTLISPRLSIPMND